MTNLLAEITIALTCITNWTGVTVGTNELGYVATNHIATIIYEGQTNTMTLKTAPSSVAVWRAKQERTLYFDDLTGDLILTNYWLPGDVILNDVTN